MPMTDAPNFGTKFGWRKPCLRYIGPLLGITCGAPVGRGDHTPPPDAPSCSALYKEGRRVTPIPVGSGTPPPPRRGGPVCPPLHASLRDPLTGRHMGRPLRILLQHPSTPGKTGGDGAPPLPAYWQRADGASAPTGLSWVPRAGRSLRTGGACGGDGRSGRSAAAGRSLNAGGNGRNSRRSLPPVSYNPSWPPLLPLCNIGLTDICQYWCGRYYMLRGR